MAPSLLRILSPLVAGVAAHVGIFIRGEWHLRISAILFGHVALLCFLWIVTTDKPSDIHHGVCRCSRWFGLYLTSLFSSMTTYRLFFHPLRTFQGPRLAATSKLWHVWKSRHSANYLVLRNMHQAYGPLVRTGPNEITIFHPNGHGLLDGARNENVRDVWYDVLHPRASLIFNRDVEEHAERRLAWSQAVSIQSTKAYAPRLLALARQLSECIASYGAKPVRVNDVMSWFSFDAMGEFSFGEDFGMMESRIDQNALTQQRRALAMMAPVNDAIWLGRLALQYLPFLTYVRDWLDTATFCEERIRKRMKSPSGKLDMSTFFIQEFYRLRRERGERASRNILYGNAISAVVAGSDTTRATLISVWYFLSKYPKHQARILSELETADTSSSGELASLPHLNAIINETLRLVPPAMTGGSRMTGPNGLWVDAVWIPGGVKVTAPKYVIHRLPCAFQSPDNFIPERWTSRPSLIHDRRAFAPFGVGSRQCIGKAISLLEIRFVVAVLLKRFRVRFSEDHDPESLLEKLKDQVTAQPGDLWCIFEAREK